VADVIATALRLSVGEVDLAGLRARVTRLADRHPLHPDLTEVPR
jgi:glycine hydroxymethyltransferase